MTEELAEVQRLSLAEEEKAQLATLVGALNDQKARYGHHCLPTNQRRRQLEAVKSQLEESLRQLDSESSSIEADIQGATDNLQGFSKSLMAAYKVDPSDGTTWSLNVIDGCFIQMKPVEKPKKKAAKKKASKNPTKGKTAKNPTKKTKTTRKSSKTRRSRK